MNKDDVITLLRAGVLIAGSVAPGVAWAAQMVDYALQQADLAAKEGRMSQEEIDRVLAEAKAGRKIADAEFDAFIAAVKARRGLET